MNEIGKNAGEGAPGYPPPRFLKDFMMEAIEGDFNQYCRTFGQPALVNSIAEFYGPKLGRKIDPFKEILVSSGANGSLSSFILALINEGDELVLFEPISPTRWRCP